MDKNNYKCPKCNSRVILSKNMYKGKSRVICFNGDCNFSMNIVEWNNNYYPQFIDNGVELQNK